MIKFIAHLFGYDIIPKNFSQKLMEESTEWEEKALQNEVERPYKAGVCAGKAKMSLEIANKIWCINKK